MIQIPELQIPSAGPADPRIDQLNKVVKLLWQEVAQLRQFISVGHGEVTVKNGGASIVLKPSGQIQIRGSEISIAGSGRVQVKASGELELKGSKIQQN